MVHPVKIDWFECQIFHCGYPGRVNVKLFLAVVVISEESDFHQCNIILKCNSCRKTLSNLQELYASFVKKILIKR